MDDRTTDDGVDATRPPSGEVLAAQIELTIAADARGALPHPAPSPARVRAPHRVGDARPG